MTLTPWGRSERLAERKPPRGAHLPRGEIERIQRERLFGAMVAAIDGKGYEATRVEDVIRIAGVSRNTFYNRCRSKEDCFRAVLGSIADAVAESTLTAYRDAEGSWNERLTGAFAHVAELIASQPAAARLCLVEAYAAGPEALAQVDRIEERALDGVRRALRDSSAHAEMPADLVRALMGGLRKVIYNRVRAERTEELPTLVPQLAAWALSYRTPPEPLRRPEQIPQAVIAAVPSGNDPRRRVLRAVSEVVAAKGYPDMAVTDIATAASISLSTFYELFEGKEAAFLATLEDGQDRALALAAPAVLAAEDWEHGVSAASHMFFGFMAAEPELAQLGGVGVWATNEPGRELRARGMDNFRALLVEGYRLYPDTSPIASEAIGASVDALLLDALRPDGPQSVSEVAPTGAFITLAPFVGVERACELANVVP